MRPRLPILSLCLALFAGSALAQTIPIPEPKPEAGDTQATPVPTPDALPDSVKTAPVPDDNKEEEKEPGDTTPKTIEPPPAIATETPADHKTCLAALSALGAKYSPQDRIDDGDGCGIDRPILVTTLLPGIALSPDGVMRCDTALNLARWVKQSVVPAAEAALGATAKLTEIRQASGYVCRKRNNANEGKLSEHARGTAVDIAGLAFSDGTSMEIAPRDEDSTLTGAFQRTITASACLYFSTVLDPGSDEAHEDHLHLDLLARNGGYRYCR